MTMRLLGLMAAMAGAAAFPAHGEAPALERPIRVVCLGDNVTAGTGLAAPMQESYPARLAALLGAGWEVHSLASPGTTLMTTGDLPLFKQSFMPTSIRLEPDVMIILLGTNDSKAPNWKDAARFVSDFRDLLQSYLAMEPAPSIWVALPPPAFGTPVDGVQPDVIRTEILPRLREVVAGLPVELLDLHTPFIEEPDLFPDGVNPNAEASSRIAQLVHNVLNPPTTTPPSPVTP